MRRNPHDKRAVNASCHGGMRYGSPGSRTKSEMVRHACRVTPSKLRKSVLIWSERKKTCGKVHTQIKRVLVGGSVDTLSTDGLYS